MIFIFVKMFFFKINIFDKNMNNVFKMSNWNFKNQLSIQQLIVKLAKV
jgi:hypothetical protein